MRPETTLAGGAGDAVALESPPPTSRAVVLAHDAGEDARRASLAASAGRSRRPRGPPRRFPAAVAAGGPSPVPRAGRSRRTRRRSRRRRRGSRLRARSSCRDGRGRGRRGARGPSRGRLGNAAIASRPARNQLPELRRGGDPAGEAAGHADDRDRLLAACARLAAACCRAARRPTSARAGARPERRRSGSRRPAVAGEAQAGRRR